MKQAILRFIYEYLANLDHKAGRKYEGETAPYCGHHYSGMDGKYVSEHFHEGDGGGQTKVTLFGYGIAYNNCEDDNNQYSIYKACGIQSSKR